MSVTLAVNAALAAPEVINGLTTVASNVETDLATHKTILQTAADAGKAALATLQNTTVTNMIGNSTAQEINQAVETGTAVEQAIQPAVPAIENAIKEIEAFIAKYL